jgi:GT2 family glycosyltransferase
VKPIILNYNNLPDTKACIKSVLEADGQTSVFLIDNASEPKCVEGIKGLYEKRENIELRLNSVNLGFTKAHNDVLKELIEKEAYVFLLNNDTVIDSGLLAVIEAKVKSGKSDMLSCKMINFWERVLMDNAGHKMLSSGEIIPIGHGDTIENFDESSENIGACAGAALYSTRMLKDIGLFDEYFETGYEDAELGLRVFIAGYKCEYEPRAIVYHKMGQSIKKIFNYAYTLKIQTNIFYTYLKLVHWQVIAINFIPWLLRFMFITLIDIVFWRPKYLKVQYHALYLILFRDWKKVMQARKESKRLRRISWWKLLMKQEFFLKRDIKSFYKFIIKGEKSYFEKY